VSVRGSEFSFDFKSPSVLLPSQALAEQSLQEVADNHFLNELDKNLVSTLPVLGLPLPATECKPAGSKQCCSTRCPG
jgi:hypothetical protein